MSLAGGWALVATLKIEGLDEYERLLSQMSDLNTVQSVCGATIYAGADVMADTIRKGIEALPVVPADKIGTPDNKLEGITSKQKDGLLDSFGITPMQHKDGFYEVKLGFDGYNDVRTTAHPNGQPNSLIARSVNSGTSFRQKIPFIDRAVRSAKKETEAAMVAACDDEFKKITKGR